MHVLDPVALPLFHCPSGYVGEVAPSEVFPEAHQSIFLAAIRCFVALCVLVIAVKQFGQRMVDDHSKAGEKLKAAASKDGITLPTSMDAKQKREMDELSSLSGAAFDRKYMDAMVEDHEKDVA